MAKKKTKSRKQPKSRTPGASLAHALSYFPDAKPHGSGQWQAPCLAHEDDKPSLSISCKPDKQAGWSRLLVYCHAGCDQKAIREAFEFDWDDLRFPSDTADEAARPGGAARRRRGAASGDQRPPTTLEYTPTIVRQEHAALLFGGEAYKYATETRGLSHDVIVHRQIGYHGGDAAHAGLAIPRFRDGVPTYRKVRIIDPPRGASKMTRWPRGVESHLFNIDDLKPGGTVIVTEGEIDALSLETAGVGGGEIAIVSIADGASTAAAASTVEPLREQIKVFVAMDADEAGESAARAMAAALGAERCYRLTFPDYKDANEALVALGPERFRSLVDQQMAAEVAVGTDAIPDERGEGDPEDPTPPAEDAETELTDLGNALRLVRAAAGRFHYVGRWDKWLAWDGKRWARDPDRRVYELASDVARSIYTEAAQAEDRDEQENIAKHALQTQRRERIEAMIVLAAKSYPTLKASPDQFDTDPLLLNVENGTIDLRTGKLRPHDKADRITKVAPVKFDESARAPRWEKFLREVLTDETLPFVQHMAGYLLTGDVREEVLFFLHGAGRNGKGVLLNMLHALLGGEYATAAPPNLLMSRKMESHPTELATLAGRRLVSAAETAKGKAWDESRVKALTGGDPISARGMREDFWEFRPTFKLVVSSNYQPRVLGTDRGIWSRLKLIPFEQEYRDADDDDPARRHLPVQDKTLKQTLPQELPGILNWAVEGCLAWQHDGGLGEPAVVREAVREYRIQEDTLRPFLNAYKLPPKGAPLDDVGEAQRTYAKTHGDRELNNRTLAAELRARGYEVKPGGKNVTMVRAPLPVKEVRSVAGYDSRGYAESAIDGDVADETGDEEIEERSSPQRKAKF